MTNMVEKEAIRAPSVPTYGYQMARAIGGKVIKKDSKKFLPRVMSLLICSESTFSIPYVTPAYRSRI